VEKRERARKGPGNLLEMRVVVFARKKNIGDGEP